jgi:3-isopropylmalate/(R)-2-methylmalate dehydratase small subunit
MIDDGDGVEVDLERGEVRNTTKNLQIEFTPLPEIMTKILRDGGLVEHIKKHGGFKLE